MNFQSEHVCVTSTTFKTQNFARTPESSLAESIHSPVPVTVDVILACNTMDHICLFLNLFKNGILYSCVGLLQLMVRLMRYMWLWFIFIAT